jgi:hypothetical protein
MRTGILFLWTGFVCCTQLVAAPVYDNDFESGDASGWKSTYKNDAHQIGVDLGGKHFLGLFGDYAQADATDSFDYNTYFAGYNNSTNPGDWVGETATLTLAGQSAGTYSIGFDFFTINTWDGNGSGVGPDTFAFAINGVEVLSGWFSANGDNSAGLTALSSNLAFTDKDGRSISSNRYSPTLVFLHGGGDMVFDFTGIPNQPDQENGSTGFVDEPWALDNVLISTIETTTIPAPGSLVLLGMGLTGIAEIRRKRLL